MGRKTTEVFTCDWCDDVICEKRPESPDPEHFNINLRENRFQSATLEHFEICCDCGTKLKQWIAQHIDESRQLS